MSVGTGDILMEVESGVYFLLGEPCEVESGEEYKFDGFYMYNFSTQKWTWYYTIFLEDEILYERVA